MHRSREIRKSMASLARLATPAKLLNGGLFYKIALLTIC
ncbi:hypothetical protein MCETALH18_00060 [Methylophilaceae bacterium]